MDTLKRTTYKLSCDRCEFTCEAESKKEMKEAVTDHLFEENHDDVGYKNWSHVVNVEKVKQYTLDWSGRGYFQG